MTAREGLINTIKFFEISSYRLALDAKVANCLLYRFLQGEGDLLNDNWIKLVGALPEEARRYYLGLIFPARVL
jgi:hypothetical protein